MLFRSKASKLEDLWIDTALDLDEVRRRIPVGTVGVIEQPPFEQNGHLISKALDNRAGAFIVLEALRAMKAAGVSQAELARRLGTSRSAVNRLVNPFYRGHSVEMLRRVAGALEAELQVKLTAKAS